MKFLVATDFSENSLHAARYAAKLAQTLKAEVILLHAWTVLPVGAGMEEVGMAQNVEKTEKDSKKKLKEIKDELQREFPVFGMTISRQGFASEVTEELAKELKADLVVAGRRGKGAVSRAIFGSVSSKLVDSKIRPLLIVPENVPLVDVKEVAFLSDFYDTDTRNLKTLVELVKPFNAHINVVHFHSNKHEKDVDRKFFKHFEEIIRETVPYEEFTFDMQDSEDINLSLEVFIREKNIQVLSIASMHRNFWQQLTDPSLTRQLVRNAKIPILIFEAHNEDVEMI